MKDFEPQKRENFLSHVEIPNTIPLLCCPYESSNYKDKDDDNDDDDDDYDDEDDKNQILLRCYCVNGQVDPCDSKEFSPFISRV